VSVCPHCGHENPEDETVCIQCGLLLHSGSPDGRGGTRRLDGVEEHANFPRWGTTRLGSERRLLLHVRGYDEPIEVPLSCDLVLGRYDPETGESPEVDLSAFDAQDLGVSRRHAAILTEEDSLKIVDLGSANSTYMNGQKLIAHQPRILRDGDELRLGRLVMRVNFI
jgi:hypothetical protein